MRLQSGAVCENRSLYFKLVYKLNFSIMKSVLYQRELSKKENSLLLKSIEFKSKLSYIEGAKEYLSVVKEWTIRQLLSVLLYFLIFTACELIFMILFIGLKYLDNHIVAMMLILFGNNFLLFLLVQKQKLLFAFMYRVQEKINEIETKEEF